MAEMTEQERLDATTDRFAQRKAGWDVPRNTLHWSGVRLSIAMSHATRALLASFGVRRRVDFEPTWTLLYRLGLIYMIVVGATIAAKLLGF
jgi:hypothetical protein